MSAPDELWYDDLHERGHRQQPAGRNLPRYIRADAPGADSALADELAALFDGNLDERFVSYERDSVLAFIVQKRRAIYDVLRAQPGGAVPRVPTQYMEDAGYQERRDGGDVAEIWRAMYDAAQGENAQG